LIPSSRRRHHDIVIINDIGVGIDVIPDRVLHVQTEEGVCGADLALESRGACEGSSIGLMVTMSKLKSTLTMMSVLVSMPMSMPMHSRLVVSPALPARCFPGRVEVGICVTVCIRVPV
jgi:hypothetical protein